MSTNNSTCIQQLPATDVRRCDWCSAPLPPDARAEMRFDKLSCRQAAFRARKLFETERANRKPKRMAYADPPYPNLQKQRYPACAWGGNGNVDHKHLIQVQLAAYDGWALSTSVKALRDVWALCPPGALMCPWVKPIGVPARSFGLHNSWEPLIVLPGRRLRPGKRDFLSAQPARHGRLRVEDGGDLVGRKPLAFCAWVFELLGMLPGDTFDDIFPGTGIVRTSWEEVSRAANGIGEASNG